MAASKRYAWTVASLAFPEGGLVLQGVFSTKAKAVAYSERLAFQTSVNRWTIDDPPTHKDPTHYAKAAV